MSQALVAEAQGVKSYIINTTTKTDKTRNSKVFDSDTMSVHLKEGVSPRAKCGKPVSS